MNRRQFFGGLVAMAAAPLLSPARRVRSPWYVGHFGKIEIGLPHPPNPEFEAAWNRLQRYLALQGIVSRPLA